MACKLVLASLIGLCDKGASNNGGDAKHTGAKHMDAGTYYVSVGRDYGLTVLIRYEYVVYKGEEVAHRRGGFKSAATARRNGLKMAAALQDAETA
jgi:hypothetical protein